MKNHLPISLLFFLLSSCFLAACAPGQVTLATLPPTLTLAPTVAPTATLPLPPTQSPSPTTAALPPAISAIKLDCTDGAVSNNGEYQAQNNTWGKGTLTDWSECIGIGIGNHPEGALVGHWTWQWPKSGGNVKAYPEIVFGQKPGSATTAESLPVLVKELSAARIAYDVTSDFTGTANLSFDIWLTNSPNPDTWGVPPITHEIMIWIDGEHEMAPAGYRLEQAEIDGTPYQVYVAEKVGDGWRYVAFVSNPAQTGVGNLDIASFLAYMQAKELATDDEYLASIEFGNEVVDGMGETILNKYQVTIEKK